MIRKYFYKLAEYYHGDTIGLWRFVGGCVLALMPIAAVVGIAFPENGFWPLNILSLLTILVALISIILTQAVKTYHRLNNERGIYKNHNFQEKLFTVVYSVAIGISVIGVFSVITLSIIQP